ncbi:MAG: hypothetical protein V2J55_18420 [Candidatus Competibacteraceae bacterium]|nr:hypothetical protein [Candidatus Competibacteraceae bacterium]
MSIYLVFAQRQYLLPKVRAFVEFMVERISDSPYWDREMEQVCNAEDIHP